MLLSKPRLLYRLLAMLILAGTFVRVAADQSVADEPDRNYHFISDDTIQKYQDASQITQDVGNKYVQAYFSKDWDTVENMLAPNMTFYDVTAAVLFGSVPHEGKAHIIDFFRAAFSAIEQMEFDPVQVFHSGNYATYAGQLSWTLKTPSGRKIRSVMPVLMSIRIEDGLVVEQRDYADYKPFIKAYKMLISEE